MDEDFDFDEPAFALSSYGRLAAGYVLVNDNRPAPPAGEPHPLANKASQKKDQESILSELARRVFSGSAPGGR